MLKSLGTLSSILFDHSGETRLRSGTHRGTREKMELFFLVLKQHKMGELLLWKYSMVFLPKSLSPICTFTLLPDWRIAPCLHCYRTITDKSFFRIWPQVKPDKIIYQFKDFHTPLSFTLYLSMGHRDSMTFGLSLSSTYQWDWLVHKYCVSLWMPDARKRQKNAGIFLSWVLHGASGGLFTVSAEDNKGM